MGFFRNIVILHMADKALTVMGRASLGLAGLGGIGSFCFFDVDGGQRAVVLNMFFGVEDKVRGEGTHFRIPWVMQPKLYDIRLRPKLIQTSTGTKDMQTVTIHVRLLFKPDIPGLKFIHTQLGPDYDERVIPSVANEV